MSGGTRRALLILAGAIFLTAIIWLIVLESNSYTRAVCRRINSFGYNVSPADLYSQGYGNDISISQVVGGELDEVRELSIECGFSAETERAGRVELLLWHMDDARVMVIWLLDREPELVFIEETGTDKVYSIQQR